MKLMLHFPHNLSLFKMSEDKMYDIWNWQISLRDFISEVNKVLFTLVFDESLNQTNKIKQLELYMLYVSWKAYWYSQST